MATFGIDRRSARRCTHISLCSEAHSARRCTHISLCSEADLLQNPHVHKSDLPLAGEEMTSLTPHHGYMEWRGPLRVQLYG